MIIFWLVYYNGKKRNLKLFFIVLVCHPKCLSGLIWPSLWKMYGGTTVTVYSISNLLLTFIMFIPFYFIFYTCYFNLSSNVSSRPSLLWVPWVSACAAAFDLLLLVQMLSWLCPWPIVHFIVQLNIDLNQLKAKFSDAPIFVQPNPNQQLEVGTILSQFHPQTTKFTPLP